MMTHGNVIFHNPSELQASVAMWGYWVRIAVNGHRQSPSYGFVPVDMVTAIDAGQCPAPRFEHSAHPLAGDRLHSSASASASSWATASQPSAASRRLARTSSIVSP